MQNIFITRLKELQGQNSVTAFARYLELPQNTVDCYVKGRRKPSVELVTRVCKKCGVSADWLLGLSDTREPSEGAARPTMLTKLQPAQPPNLSDELAAIRRQLAHQASEISALKELNTQTTAFCG